MTLYSTSPWFILWKQIVKFVSKFLCFNWIFGFLRMYWKFHVSSSCYNSCKIHVLTPSNGFKSRFQDHFMTYSHVSIVHDFVCLCFNIPIHSKQHSSNDFYCFLGFYVSHFFLFTCVMFSLVMVPLHFMFWVCCCNIHFLVFFLVEWLGGTWGVTPSNKSVESLALRANLSKLKLHASLSP
jgi:hypothetical protein